MLLPLLYLLRQEQPVVVALLNFVYYFLASDCLFMYGFLTFAMGLDLLFNKLSLFRSLPAQTVIYSTMYVWINFASTTSQTRVGMCEHLQGKSVDQSRLIFSTSCGLLPNLVLFDLLFFTQVLACSSTSLLSVQVLCRISTCELHRVNVMLELRVTCRIYTCIIYSVIYTHGSLQVVIYSNGRGVSSRAYRHINSKALV